VSLIRPSFFSGQLTGTAVKAVIGSDFDLNEAEYLPKEIEAIAIDQKRFFLSGKDQPQ
jgi:hypothetical protein